MSGAGIKLQINSKEAIERLIGTDDTFAVEVRDNVAKWLSETYFANIIKNGAWGITAEVQKRIDTALAKAVEDTLANIKKERPNYYQPEVAVLTLKPEITNLIKDSVKAHIETLVREACDSAKLSVTAKVTSAVETSINKYVKDLVKSMVQEQITTQLQEIMKHLTSMAAYYKSEAASNKERKIDLHL
jgi:hypothetical protein